MTAEQMWESFITQENIINETYEAWAFGGAPDELAELVAAGKKTATASAFPLYEIENEPLPVVGAYNIILNSKDEAMCIIQTTKVYVVPFNEVSKDHAFKEGEGDRSLEYWKKVHREFFSECLRELELCFDENMKVVCEEFKVVYK